MDAVVRAAIVYIGLMVIFRLTGKRAIAQITTFDFVLLLIIAEATQQALLGDDFSVTNAFVIILTLIAIDLGLSLVSARSKTFSLLVDGAPLVVVDHGVPLQERLDKSQLTLEDVLEEARRTQGLERLDQIKYAVLEKTGSVSIIPYRA